MAAIETESDEPIGTGSEDSPHRLNRGPQLPEIYKTLRLLKSVKAIDGTGQEAERSHLELYKDVAPYTSAVELSDNVRQAVIEFVKQNYPAFRSAMRQSARAENSTPGVHAISTMDDETLTKALANNFFDEIPETMKGTPRELLLTVTAHVVKRLETKTYQSVLTRAGDQELETLGLTPPLRDLVVSLLDVSLKSDPLFIRISAFGQATGEQPEGASAFGMVLPDREGTHTLVTAFPKETGFIAKRLGAIATNNEAWQTDPEGSYTPEEAQLFAEYLSVLSQFYLETDPGKAQALHQTISELFEKLARTDFPVFMLPATESYHVKPYLDPELSVYLASADSKPQEALYEETKNAMADSLGVIGQEQFSPALRQTMMRQFVTFGSHGFNLIFRQAAQELPIGLIFADEQARQMDRDFAPYLSMISNFEEASKPMADMDANFPKFAAMLKEAEPNAFDAMTNDEKRTRFIEYMCRMSTVFHELSHPVYLDGCAESQHIGDEPLEAIDEAKADTIYRPLLPEIIARGGIEGSPELWACGSLAASLQVLRDNSPGDPYFMSNTYAINDLFAPQPDGSPPVVVTTEHGLMINDTDAYYHTAKASADRLLKETYENPAMRPAEAEKWIEKYCEPNPELGQAIKKVTELYGAQAA